MIYPHCPHCPHCSWDNEFHTPEGHVNGCLRDGCPGNEPITVEQLDLFA